MGSGMGVEFVGVGVGMGSGIGVEFVGVGVGMGSGVGVRVGVIFCDFGGVAVICVEVD